MRLLKIIREAVTGGTNTHYVHAQCSEEARHSQHLHYKESSWIYELTWLFLCQL